MKRILPILFLAFAMSCHQSEDIENQLEWETFLKSPAYKAAISQGYSITNNHKTTSSETGESMLEITINQSELRLDYDYKITLVASIKNGEVDDALIIGESSTLSTEQSGKAFIHPFLESNDVIELEFKDGMLLNLKEYANVRTQICRDVRQVSYCAGSRLEDMNWVEQSFCFVGFAGCMAELYLSCYADGCNS